MVRMKLWSLFASGLLAGTFQVPTGAQSIPAGTQLRVELDSTVDTRSSVIGQAVQATVLEPVLKDGQAIIPAGSTLSGHIESVQPHRRKEKQRAAARLLFDTISLPDQRVIQCRTVISGAGFVYSVGPDGDVSADTDFEFKPRRKLWVQLADDFTLNGAKPSDATSANSGAKSLPTLGKGLSKDTHSVRMGELLVSADSVENFPAGSSGLAHEVFTVHVQMHNVGKQFPCTQLTVYLLVEPFYQYAEMLNGHEPSTSELLPGEITEGQYSFDIREGVVPKELLLKAQEGTEERCATHRDWGSVWHWQDSATIPLKGLTDTSNSKMPAAEEEPSGK